MSRDWHQYEYVHEFALDEAFHQLDLEVAEAAAGCPADASGQLVRLIVEAKREVLSRLRDALGEARQPLSQVLDEAGVWGRLSDEE